MSNEAEVSFRLFLTSFFLPSDIQFSLSLTHSVRIVQKAMADAVAVAPEAVKDLDPTQIEVKLFNRWTFDDVQVFNRSFPILKLIVYFIYLLLKVLDQVNDISLNDYIGVAPSKHATYVPHTAGRYSVKRFRKAQCPIVERLTNSLMMHGRNNGKKLMAVRIIKHAMEIIHLLTDQNPIQVIVDAVINRYDVILVKDYFLSAYHLCIDGHTLCIELLYLS